MHEGGLRPSGSVGRRRRRRWKRERCSVAFASVIFFFLAAIIVVPLRDGIPFPGPVDLPRPGLGLRCPREGQGRQVEGRRRRRRAFSVRRQEEALADGRERRRRRRGWPNEKRDDAPVSSFSLLVEKLLLLRFSSFLQPARDPLPALGRRGHPQAALEGHAPRAGLPRAGGDGGAAPLRRGVGRDGAAGLGALRADAGDRGRRGEVCGAGAGRRRGAVRGR